MAEPKTLFRNKTKQIIYLVTSFDKYFKYTNDLSLIFAPLLTYMTPPLKYLEAMLNNKGTPRNRKPNLFSKSLHL